MFVLKFFLWVIFVFPGINGDYCLSNDDNPYEYFSAKTAYGTVRGNDGAENGGNLSRCKAMQSWLISRHGTRYPDSKDMNEMKKSIWLKELLIKNYESGSAPSVGGLCYNDYLNIKNWTWDESMESQSTFLNEQGWVDIYEIAKRYLYRYPEIFGGPYRREDFYFRHTATQRTEESCKAFIDGLFGNGSHHKVFIEKATIPDDIIGPDCDLWDEEIGNNPDNNLEKLNFRKSSDYLELLNDITNRMGFSKLLKHGDIKSMYNNCRYDKTRYLNRISPWCAVFTKKQLVLMEYLSDISRYYKYSYAHPINAKLGCMPLRHLLETFSRTIENFDGSVVGPKLVAMFSHDTMLDLMFSAMEFAKDQHHLSGSNYEDMLINRRYRISMHTPFAANLVAVLYHCGEDEDEPFKIQFFLNEKQMMLPGCDRGLCSWGHLQQFYANAFDCNLDFCYTSFNLI